MNLKLGKREAGQLKAALGSAIRNEGRCQESIRNLNSKKSEPAKGYEMQWIRSQARIKSWRALLEKIRMAVAK